MRGMVRNNVNSASINIAKRQNQLIRKMFNTPSKSNSNKIANNSFKLSHERHSKPRNYQNPTRKDMGSYYTPNWFG